MVSLNEIKLTGNLSANPELKVIGQSEDHIVVEGTLIHNWRANLEDQEERKAIIGIKVYGKNARRFASTVTTKTNILVSGHLETDTWRDGDQPRSRTYLYVRSFQYNSPVAVANSTPELPAAAPESSSVADQGKSRRPKNTPAEV